MAEDISHQRLREEVYNALSGMDVGELASHYEKAPENERTVLRDYLGAQPSEFQIEFKTKLNDVTLNDFSAR